MTKFSENLKNRMSLTHSKSDGREREKEHRIKDNDRLRVFRYRRFLFFIKSSSINETRKFINCDKREYQI